MGKKPAWLGASSVLNAPRRPLLVRGALHTEVPRSSFGDHVWVGEMVVMQEGVRIGDDSIIGDGCFVKANVVIGKRTLLTYRAQVCEEVEVGDDCVIGSFLCERTHVGDGSRVFGKTLHRHIDPTRNWDADESMEMGPAIGSCVFVGFDALIVGDVSIGDHSYICPGSIVTKSVPEFSIVSGRNQVVRYSDWDGPLSESPVFRATV